MLRKDDPVYYKVKMKELLKQALDNGLEINGSHIRNGVIIYFKSIYNGDIAGITLTEEGIK